MMDSAVEHAVEDVSVVNLQVTGRFQAHGLRDSGLIPRDWKLPSGHIDQHGSITNHLGVADIRARHESGVSVEVCCDVLKHELVGEPASDVVQDGFCISSELVARSGKGC